MKGYVCMYVYMYMAYVYMIDTSASNICWRENPFAENFGRILATKFEIFDKCYLSWTKP